MPDDALEPGSLSDKIPIRQQYEVIMKLFEALDTQLAKLDYMLKHPDVDMTEHMTKATSRKIYKQIVTRVMNGDYWMTFN
jgi:hypothetical protein